MKTNEMNFVDAIKRFMYVLFRLYTSYSGFCCHHAEWWNQIKLSFITFYFCLQHLISTFKGWFIILPAHIHLHLTHKIIIMSKDFSKSEIHLTIISKISPYWFEKSFYHQQSTIVKFSLLHEYHSFQYNISNSYILSFVTIPSAVYEFLCNVLYFLRF
jgi:hypothetical protein